MINQDSLNLTYEIEGLISLKLQRADQTPEEVDTLIKEKVLKLAQMLDLSMEIAPEPISNEFAEVKEIESVPEIEPKREESTEEPTVQAPKHDNQAIFTINDTYRFKRELFGNSNENFQETLNMIQAMESYEEAEDYFYHDLLWDPDNEEVKAFMEVLKNHFNQH